MQNETLPHQRFSVNLLPFYDIVDISLTQTTVTGKINLVTKHSPLILFFIYNKRCFHQPVFSKILLLDIRRLW